MGRMRSRVSSGIGPLDTHIAPSDAAMVDHLHDHPACPQRLGRKLLAGGQQRFPTFLPGKQAPRLKPQP